MKILLVDHYAGAPRWGMEYRPYYLARQWQAMGAEVRILAADFTHLRRKNPVQNQSLAHLREDGVEFLLLQTPPYERNDRDRAKNIWAFLRGFYRAIPALAESFSPDVVIASSTYPFDFYPAQRLAKHCGAKLVFELHDIWPLSLLELYDYSPHHPLMRLIDRAERRALSQADLVVSLLPFAHNYLEERGITPQGYVYIPNGMDPREPLQPPPCALRELTDRYRRKGMFLVMYLGGFSAANAMEAFVEAAARCTGNQMFLAVGNGPLKIALRRKAKEVGAHNLLFLDGVEKGQVQGVLAQADCLFIGARQSELYRYGVSMNKLFDYMLAAKPILCGVQGEQSPVALADCGILVNGEDPQSIADGVAQLEALSPRQRAEMGERGRQYVLAHHDYKVLAARFLQAVTGEEEGDYGPADTQAQSETEKAEKGHDDGENT